jgi:uncharacterized protein
LKSSLAIFVKTPGRSPVKTRLAKTIGKDAAEEIYRLSVKAVAEVVRDCGALDINWAIAESSSVASNHWKNFTTIDQGSGDLGERLSYVYAKLRTQKNVNVILIGADAPQIDKQLFADTLQLLLKSNTCVFGPSTDGGFYLFGANFDIALEIWQAVPYSASDTMSVLRNLLERQGHEIQLLRPLTDIDHEEDLQGVYKQLRTLRSPTISQTELIRHLESKYIGRNNSAAPPLIP